MSNHNRTHASLFVLDSPQETDVERSPIVAYAIASIVAVPLVLAGWPSHAFAQDVGAEGTGDAAAAGPSPDGDAPGHPEPGFAAAIPDVQTGGATDISGMMGDGAERVIVIDVRPAGDFARSHIPKAINMEVRYSTVVRDHVIDDATPLGTDKSARIVVYGAGANDPAAAAVVRHAAAEGYTNVIWMRGGFAEWVSARLPTTTS